MPNFMVKLEKDASFADTAADLTGLGFEIYREIPDLRTISGSAPAALAKEILAHPGVSRVREEDSYQLPPIDGGLPQ